MMSGTFYTPENTKKMKKIISIKTSKKKKRKPQIRILSVS